MTTYLTKTEDGKTFHFRVRIEDNGIDVVEGQFYKSISKWFKGTGTPRDQATPSDRAQAETEAQKLIAEKIAQGYYLTDFVESKENNYHIYDMAKYHINDKFPKRLKHFQAHVHTGMFITWLIDNDLLDADFFEDVADELENVKSRKLTGSRFYETFMDGAFAIEEVSETGNRFALDYFDFDTGKYITDYEKTLAADLPSFFHVKDTWDNYFQIKTVIDKRFTEWQKKNSKKPWWKIW